MRAILKVLFIGLINVATPSFFVLGNCDTQNQEQAKEEMISGVVTAIEWDEEKNVTAVAITIEIVPDDSTEDTYYEKYRVANDEKGLELLEMVGELVEATGKIEIDEEDNKLIYINRYKVIIEE